MLFTFEFTNWDLSSEVDVCLPMEDMVAANIQMKTFCILNMLELIKLRQNSKNSHFDK
jgi:hypothetical protein